MTICFFCSEVMHDIDYLKSTCNIIIANRYNAENEDGLEKDYTRDLYFRD